MAPESESLVIGDYHGGRLAEAHAAGTMEKADFQALAPALKPLVRKHRMIRMLLQLHHFRGWQKGACWQDLSPADLPPFGRIERLALVAHPRWQAGSLSFTRPFAHAWVRFFPTRNRSEALSWIDEGLVG